MIIVELSGGLGNQMFQFCLYKKLKVLGKEVYLDSSAYTHYDSKRKYELDKFQGISKEDLAFVNETDSMGKGFSNIIFRAKRFICNQNNRVYFDKIAIYQPEVFFIDYVRLRGYWQNEKYFNDLRDVILECFTFREDEFDDETVKYVEKMDANNSVSIHVRRGDYLETQFKNVYSDICSEHYYSRAVEYIFQEIEEPFFYVFSDDIEWCKRNVDLFFGDYYDSSKIQFVASNEGNKSYIDMYLMSKCKHHIIANSTFSWWGAWLGTNPDKIVLAPNKWFANRDTLDIICNDWIKIEIL